MTFKEIKKAIQAIGAKGVRVSKSAETQTENQGNIFVEAWNTSYPDIEAALNGCGFMMVHSVHQEASATDSNKTALVRLS